ncbi:AI-2E family transporter [Bacillus massilinigeriensis]|uniref:AI-2E family transporter n=1 Tax=Bacillus massilionigeriensis TaxID=1805475 RepID=UPI00096ADDC3|nr:AI-2E family transporter [Bacillus massilionigeriensis]
MDIRVKWYYRLGFLLLLFIVVLVFLKLQQIWLPIMKAFMYVLIPFAIAAFITYLLHPVVENIHERGIPRGLAIILIYFIFFGGVGMAVYKGIPAFIAQLKDLTENAPYFSNQYRSWIEAVQHQTSKWPNTVQERVEQGITTVETSLGQLFTKVINVLVRILNSIVVIAIIPFIAFYMLKDIDLIKKTCWYLTPRKWRKEGILFLRDVNKSLGGYIRGQLLVCLIIGTLSSVLFWIIDMKYPLLLGSIVGITNVIPYFGPFIGAIPAVIIAATISVKMVVFSAIIIILLQFMEGNIVSPLIMGKSLHMHPLMIMFALLSGGQVGGILGMILAVPILAIIKVGMLHARHHFGKSRLKIEP